MREARNQFIESVAKASTAESVTRLVGDSKAALVGFENQWKGHADSAKNRVAAEPSLAERLAEVEASASKLGAELS